MKRSRLALAETMDVLSHRLTVNHLAESVTGALKTNVASLTDGLPSPSNVKPMSAPVLISGLLALAAGSGWSFARAREGREPVQRTTKAVAADVRSFASRAPRRKSPANVRFWLMSAASLAGGAAVAAFLPETPIEQRVASSVGPVVRQGAQDLIERQVDAAKKLAGGSVRAHPG